MDTFLSFIVAAVLAATPLLFGTLGEILTEKGGHLNLGVEGMMFMGGVAGLAGTYYYEKACGGEPNALVSVVIGIICAFLCAMFGAFIYSVLTITFRANQNVTGLALTTLGIGLGNFLGASLINITKSELPSIALTKTSSFFAAKLPFADKLGWFGDLFLSHDFLTYFAIIISIVVEVTVPY